MSGVVDQAEVDACSQECWRLREIVDAKRKAGEPDAVCRPLAREYIKAVYSWQKAKYGAVIRKVGVASILR